MQVDNKYSRGFIFLSISDSVFAGRIADYLGVYLIEKEGICKNGEENLNKTFGGKEYYFCARDDLEDRERMHIVGAMFELVYDIEDLANKRVAESYDVKIKNYTNKNIYLYGDSVIEVRDSKIDYYIKPGKRAIVYLYYWSRTEARWAICVNGISHDVNIPKKLTTFDKLRIMGTFETQRKIEDICKLIYDQ